MSKFNEVLVHRIYKTPVKNILKALNGKTSSSRLESVTTTSTTTATTATAATTSAWDPTQSL